MHQKIFQAHVCSTGKGTCSVVTHIIATHIQLLGAVSSCTLSCQVHQLLACGTCLLWASTTVSQYLAFGSSGRKAVNVPPSQCSSPAVACVPGSW